MSNSSKGSGPAAVALLVGLAVGGALGCSDEPELFDPPVCEDDAIGWPLELAGVIELPDANFEVECASGWGHGVDTRAASEVVELPNAFQYILPHPQGGLLLSAYARESRWSERLGVDVAANSLMWLDEQAEQVHWLRDDLRYYSMRVVTGETQTELWAWGADDVQEYLSRIDPGTGELLERVEWSDGQPMLTAVAWPPQGGLWQLTRDSFDTQYEYYGLRRMSSFAVLGDVVRTFDAPVITFVDGSRGVYVPTVEAIPEGGALFGTSTIEALAEDGSSRWTLDEPHAFRIVDTQGGFLLANVADGDSEDHRAGLSLQRRSLDDASLIWERVHHRFEFVHTPEPGEYLSDISYGYAARADGGYLLAGGHSYPSSSCPQQPIVWAIDSDGEVEWAHRMEVCGDAFLPTDRVDGRALVLGFSAPNGDQSNVGTTARWLEVFDL